MYRGVCATCHSLNRIAFRNMDGVAFTTEELKEMAAEVRMMFLVLPPSPARGIESSVQTQPPGADS